MVLDSVFYDLLLFSFFFDELRCTSNSKQIEKN